MALRVGMIIIAGRIVRTAFGPNDPRLAAHQPTGMMISQ